jgi:2-polyprenyl-3-methyl-5-hydroxy-6-metoxy-1,4-benzoquinol methylase
MGEVLEHVEDPRQLLRRAASFVRSGGRLFVTTCANCPAIDHVYLFKSVQEIRDLIASAGCGIEREHVTERDYGMRGKDGLPILTAQYAAVLLKQS